MNTVNLAKLYLQQVQLKNVKLFPEHQTVKVEQPEDEIIFDEDVNDEDYLFRGITENEHTRQQLIKAFNDYKSDSRNNISNDFYRSMVFECILYDEIFKANGKPSFFDKACQIVNDKKSMFNFFKPKYKNTYYPNNMVQEWLIYCSEIPFRSFLMDEECSIHYFMIAYHYVLEPKTS